MKNISLMGFAMRWLSKLHTLQWNAFWFTIVTTSLTQANTPAQPAKPDLNKKSFSKQKTIQNFTIDAQGFRKMKNENLPTWEMGVTS